MILNPRFRTSPTGPRRAIATAALFALVFAALPATALDFQVDFRESTYQVDGNDAFADLLAQHERETLIQSNVTDGLETISTAVHGGGVNSNYSVLLSTEVTVGTSGRYAFQVGTDWGRGGAAALVDSRTGAILSERVITDDVWWAYNWDHDDVFTTEFDFVAGDAYTLYWVGFEGCCGGTTSLRFSFDGGDFAPLASAQIEPYLVVPEPTSALLVGMGLACLTRVAPRRRRKPDCPA